MQKKEKWTEIKKYEITIRLYTIIVVDSFAHTNGMLHRQDDKEKHPNRLRAVNIEIDANHEEFQPKNERNCRKKNGSFAVVGGYMVMYVLFLFFVLRKRTKELYTYKYGLRTSSIFALDIHSLSNEATNFYCGAPLYCISNVCGIIWVFFSLHNYVSLWHCWRLNDDDVQTCIIRSFCSSVCSRNLQAFDTLFKWIVVIQLIFTRNHLNIFKLTAFAIPACFIRNRHCRQY